MSAILELVIIPPIAIVAVGAIFYGVFGFHYFFFIMARHQKPTTSYTKDLKLNLTQLLTNVSLLEPKGLEARAKALRCLKWAIAGIILVGPLVYFYGS